MQNPIQKFRQNSIVFKKPGILTENLKTLVTSNYPTVQYFGNLQLPYSSLPQLPYSSIFFGETQHKFPTYKCLQKRVWDFFCLVQILSDLQKLKRPDFYTLVFYIFINDSRSTQNKKISRTPFFYTLLKVRSCKLCNHK